MKSQSSTIDVFTQSEIPVEILPQSFTVPKNVENSPIIMEVKFKKFGNFVVISFLDMGVLDRKTLEDFISTLKTQIAEIKSLGLQIVSAAADISMLKMDPESKFTSDEIKNFANEITVLLQAPLYDTRMALNAKQESNQPKAEAEKKKPKFTWWRGNSNTQSDSVDHVVSINDVMELVGLEQGTVGTPGIDLAITTAGVELYTKLPEGTRKAIDAKYPSFDELYIFLRSILDDINPKNSQNLKKFQNKSEH